jgi:hypothetical protein
MQVESNSLQRRLCSQFIKAEQHVARRLPSGWGDAMITWDCRSDCSNGDLFRPDRNNETIQASRETILPCYGETTSRE